MSSDWKLPCWFVTAPPGGLHTCLLTCCCPCVTYGTNVSKFPDTEGILFAGNFAPACCLYCITASVGFPCIMHIPTRKFLRGKYGIKEPAHGLLEDVFMTWCCSCCVLIQDSNEIAIQSSIASGGAILTDLKKAMNTPASDVKGNAEEADNAEKKDESKPAATETKDESKPAAAE